MRVYLIWAVLSMLLASFSNGAPVNKQTVQGVRPQKAAVAEVTPTAPPVEQTQPETQTVVEETPQPTPVPTDHEELMVAAGITPEDYGAVDYIVSHESGWNYLAVNSEGATGLCQALPGYKMASIADDYLVNPVTQLRWCSSYAEGRYGSWWNAYNAWVSQGWW